MSDEKEFFPPSLEEASDGTTETSTEKLWQIIGPPAVVAVIAGPADGRTLKLDDLPIVVGRSQSLADLAIDDEGMSKRHFRISRERDQIVVQDLKSSNGTLVNGQLVDRMKVHHGDTVGAGSTLMQFVTLRSASDPPQDEQVTQDLSQEEHSAPEGEDNQPGRRKRSRTTPGMTPDEEKDS